ncbi:MAG: isochorismate synthase [FCB group bacterium]|jgi:menaquinone-specific isochorismate synthase|nr:isochorismate synthase [FCB group bacterium]
MSSSLTPPEAYEPEPARRSLAALVEQLLLESLDGASAPGCALRVEMPVRRTDAQAWLRAQDAGEKTYWADRSGVFEIAGIGSADTLVETNGDGSGVFARLRERLACAHPRLRYLGGLRFNTRVPSSEAWRPFGACRFVLPRFELMVADGHSYLACNLIAPEQARVDELFEEIHAGLHSLQFPEPGANAPMEPPLARTDSPDREGWTRTINEALSLLHAGELEKIVLARESRFDFPSASDAGELLRRLTLRVGRAYRFYFQPARGVAFLGASPERLYKRHGRHLESEAVAGTRPRGRTPEEDEALSRELLASEKDVREHRFVVDALVAGFASLCGAVQRGDELSLLRLSECQHLHRRIEGILAETSSDAEILRVLHPTPAVGGSPKREAMDWIARLEPFDRGWYAGPVGWVSRDAAEFAVGIRCGLVHDASISVYSGAGIVPGSTPQGEWDEIEGKMSNLSRVLVGDEI